LVECPELNDQLFKSLAKNCCSPEIRKRGYSGGCRASTVHSCKEQVAIGIERSHESPNVSFSTHGGFNLGWSHFDIDHGIGVLQKLVSYRNNRCRFDGIEMKSFPEVIQEGKIDEVQR
jgi:hypothetical protein